MAYEMSISDWSSDVCSSDRVRMHFGDDQRPWQAHGLQFVEQVQGEVGIVTQAEPLATGFACDQLHQHVDAALGDGSRDMGVIEAVVVALRMAGTAQGAGQIGRASCRERVCEYV